ncbi:hypothetical protein V8E51_006801 [Hyaloscypha variabilis]
MAGSLEELPTQCTLHTATRNNSPPSCALGTDSPPILDDNELLEQRLDHRLIPPAGPFNHVMRSRANKCRQ